MKKIGRYIVLFLISIGITVFLVFTSFSFGSEGGITQGNENNPNKISFSLPNITSDNVVKYDVIGAKNVTNDDIFFADFGRLASGFFVNLGGEQHPEQLISRNGIDIVMNKIRGIVSWYDPFVNYVLRDSGGNFRLEQITNGSMYISHEDDGSVILYSVDMVAELTFLVNDEKKTSMIIFPGMYFQFDPEQNVNLGGADLLRIIQVQDASSKATGIDFINSRIEGNVSQFGPYQLLNHETTRKLFQFLELSSQERMKTVDGLKNYTKVMGNFSSDTSNISNPTKRMYRILGELQMLFSHAINEEIEIQEFRDKTASILLRAKEFKMEDTAKKMIEQFLIDGRFALFNDTPTSKGHYQKLYDSAANILEITPTTPKGRMLQTLANMFSRNILESKLAHNKAALDTANVLNATLSQVKNEITTSDYFDISFYSFLLLRVMANIDGTEEVDGNEVKGNVVFYRRILGRDTIESESLYRMYRTIFDATQRYTSGLSDAKKFENAQSTLMANFYIPMLHLLVNSLYQTYTTVENGEIHMKNSFINRGIPEISSYNHKEILNNLANIHSIAYGIYHQHIYGLNNPSLRSSKIVMEGFLKRLEGFVAMMNALNYRDYQESPYLAESAHLPFPKYNVQTGQLERKKISTASQVYTPKPTPQPSENTEIEMHSDKTHDNALAEVERIVKIITTLTGISVDINNIAEETTGKYHVQMDVQGKKLTFVFTSGNNQISKLGLATTPQIQFADTLLITTLREIIPKISAYEKHIEKIVTNNHLSSAEVVLIHYAQKRIQIGSKFFPLVP